MLNKGFASFGSILFLGQHHLSGRSGHHLPLSVLPGPKADQLVGDVQQLQHIAAILRCFYVLVRSYLLGELCG